MGASIETFAEDLFEKMDEAERQGRETARQLQENFKKDPVLNILLADLRGALKGKNLERIKEMGRKFDEIGGFEMMQMAASTFYPHRNFHDLNLYWNGIGEWQY